jgi:hypothetical protein
MTTLNVPVDVTELAALLVQAGYEVTPPAVVVVPVPVTPQNTVIYNGKLDWLGDWSGGGVKIDYADTVLVPGKTVASILNVGAYGYWLPYILHMATLPFKSLVLKLKPAVPGAHFGLATYTSTGSTTDIVVGGLDTIAPYGGTPDADGIITYTVPLTALKSSNIDLYKILVQDKSGTKGTKWAVELAEFV